MNKTAKKWRKAAKRWEKAYKRIYYRWKVSSAEYVQKRRVSVRAQNTEKRLKRIEAKWKRFVDSISVR